MRSFRTVWNTENGKQDFETMDSSMHLSLLEIKIGMAIGTAMLAALLENMDTWQIRQQK